MLAEHPLLRELVVHLRLAARVGESWRVRGGGAAARLEVLATVVGEIEQEHALIRRALCTRAGWALERAGVESDALVPRVDGVGVAVQLGAAWRRSELLAD